MKLEQYLLSGALALGLGSCTQPVQTPASQTEQQTQKPQKPAAPKEDKNKELRGIILSYLSQPDFSGTKFLRRLTGSSATLQMYNLGEQKVYFSLPANQYEGEKSLQRLTRNIKGVEFGKTDNGEFLGQRIKLGEYILNMPQHYFFRFPADDFKVDKNTKVSNKLGSVTYSQSMQELSDFLRNANTYDGCLEIDAGFRNGMQIVSHNHSPYIARKGEPSLTRLVRAIVGGQATKEQTAQRLLDFVTNQIKYSHSDADSDVQVVKRPNEVLMTGEGSCSGKTIVLASLLEQTAVEYRLAYILPNHITVVVEGNYNTANGGSFNIGKTEFTFAEGTTPGYIIGETNVKPPLKVERIHYLQNPGDNAKLYDAKTGKEVPYLNCQ